MDWAAFTIFVIYFVLVIRHLGIFKDSRPSVTIDQGKLIGRLTLDYNNDTYYIFEGIPYAKPPVGALRFKAPELPEPWIGVYDATQPKPACAQAPYRGTDPGEYSENCLFLNVHTKLTNKLKPVMVWIHGGAFDSGSISTKSHGSQWLMTEDIVFVEMQYRLNIFGFLSFDDSKYGIPGNAGFKDQVMGLKWIRKNIKHFGGDPKKVTLFGISAGGASVHLLCVSPMAKGLFHRAIIQSGVGTSTFVYNAIKYPQLAEALNCSLSNNLDGIVNCVNSSTTEQLLSTTPMLQANLNRTVVDDITLSVLTIEDQNSFDPFLPGPVEEQIRNNKFHKVPMIMGVCANESASFVYDKIIAPNFTESDYGKLVPKDLNVETRSTEAFKIGKQIKEFYYGNHKPSYDLLEPFIRYLSDLQFIQKVYYTARLHKKYAPEVPLYFYKFDYLTRLNSNFTRNDNYVHHGDDMAYLFTENGDRIAHQLDPNSDEYIGMRRIVKLWTAFAKTGDPNSHNDAVFNDIVWKPMTSDDLYYLNIRPNLELHRNLYEDRMAFWDSLYEKYGTK